MAEQELAWLASHKEQIAALGEDPNLVKALERELARSASKARPPAPYDASQLRLGDDAFAARVLPSDRKSVWLDTAPPPRAAPPPPRAPPPADPRTWTRAVDPASGYAYRYDANGNSVWEHELAPAPPVAAQPIPKPSDSKASKRAPGTQVVVGVLVVRLNHLGLVRRRLLRVLPVAARVQEAGTRRWPA